MLRPYWPIPGHHFQNPQGLHRGAKTTGSRAPKRPLPDQRWRNLLQRYIPRPCYNVRWDDKCIQESDRPSEDGGPGNYIGAAFIFVGIKGIGKLYETMLPGRQ
jgi:hypothetical protein